MGFLFLLGILISPAAHAQDPSVFREDRVSIQYRSYEGGIEGIRFGGGAPPLFFGPERARFLILNAGFEWMKIDFGNVQGRFRSFGLAPIFINRLNEEWGLTFVLPFSFATQIDGVNAFDIKASSFVSAVEFRHGRVTDPVKYGLGLVVIKLASSLRVFPSFSLRYLSEDKTVSARFGFPRADVRYRMNDRWSVGSGLGLDFNTYLIDPRGSFNTGNASYLNSQRIVFGLESSYEVFEHFWVTLFGGRVIAESLFLSNSDRESVADLTRLNQNGWFWSSKIGFRF